MSNLGPFDRERILEDISTTEELIARTEHLVTTETRPERKAALISTVASLKQELRNLKTLLQ